MYPDMMGMCTYPDTMGICMYSDIFIMIKHICMYSDRPHVYAGVTCMPVMTHTGHVRIHA